MGRVVGELLPLAAVVAISPVPVLAALLMLLTPKAGLTGPGFLAGWIIGIAGVTTTVLLLTGTDPTESGPSSVASWIELGLGAVALPLAARQWISRPKPGEQPRLPGWMAAVDRFTAVRAAGLGLVLSALNPKAVLVCIAAGAVIASRGLSGSQALWSVALFTVIAASTVAIPVLAYVVGRKRMAGPLATLRRWLTAHSAVATATLLVLIGIILISQGLSGLI